MSEEALNRGSLWKGFGIGAAASIGGAFLGVVTIAAIIGIIILVAFGLVQLAWQLPLYFSFRQRGETETAKGVLIALAIGVLINAGCWGYIGVTGLNFR